MQESEAFAPGSERFRFVADGFVVDLRKIAGLAGVGRGGERAYGGGAGEVGLIVGLLELGVGFGFHHRAKRVEGC